MSSQATHATRRRIVADVRPLDPANSIKVKIGLLVVADVIVATWVTWLSLTRGLSIWVTLAVTVAVSLLVTLWLAHGMIAPLREMRTAARAMADGDYSIRVRATSEDEVGQLAEAFNAMAAELAASDQMRRDLVANVAHELRTPLAALQAQTENLVDGVIPVSPAALNPVLAQTRRLSELVAFLLDLSRLEAGASALRPQETRVTELLDQCAFDLGPVADAVGTRIETSVTPPDLTLVADPGRLAQVLANVVGNAIKHSPPGTAVTVTAAAAAQGSDVVIEVSDQGPGIDPHDRERIFARFARGGETGPIALSSAATRANGPMHGGGTGLGLAIARWAVELHGGQISVADSPDGAAFRIRLPHDGPPAPRPAET